MALIPVHHARTLRSPAEAEALFRALGQKTVGLNGLRTTDAARYDRVIDAVVTKRDHTISFDGGSLVHARPPLDALVSAGDYGYFDLRTPHANLRVWPALYSWVHSSDGIEAASRAWGAPLSPGANLFGDTKLTIATDPARGWPIDLDTRTIATALRVFHGLSGDASQTGFAMRITEPCKPRLRAFLHALGAEVRAVMEVDLATARALTELCPEVEWQSGEIVRFPDGEITTYLRTPKVDERFRAKARNRIDKAFAKAKL